MAGIKASSGGARPGAGRPRNPPVLLDVGRHDDPLDFLQACMQVDTLDLRLRIVAAKALLRYAVATKKEQATDAAKRAATGRYATARPPPLQLV